MIASILAGHDNTNMTAFYFSNVAEYVECKARRQYVRMIQGKQTYSISKRYNQPLLAKTIYLLATTGSAAIHKWQNMTSRTV